MENFSIDIFKTPIIGGNQFSTEEYEQVKKWVKEKKLFKYKNHDDYSSTKRTWFVQIDKVEFKTFGNWWYALLKLQKIT